MKSIFTDGEPVTLLVPPKLHGMMTGVAQVTISHPRYRLTYTDGTWEEATVDIPQEDRHDIFKLTSAIQTAARQ